MSKYNKFTLLFRETVKEQKERRLKEAIIRNEKLLRIEGMGICEGMYGPCREFNNPYNKKNNVSWIPSMSHYYWDIDKFPLEDPNRDLFLCENCAKLFNEHWQEKWEEYYNGCM
jgi:hypothetical protein